MGTDIHLRVEKKDGSGVWHSVERYTKRSVVYPYTAGTPEGDEMVEEVFFHDRNYTLFAMLADVRNYAGINPIAEARDLPDDLSKENSEPIPNPYYGKYDEEEEFINPIDYYFGDHSFSWLTLQELLEYDWSQILEQEGFLSALEYEEWDVMGKSRRAEPKAYTHYAGAISGTVVEEEVMNSIIQEIRDRCRSSGYYSRKEVRDEIESSQLKDFYCSVSWDTTYANEAGSFYTEFLPVLLKMAEGDFNSVRIVFGFDS